MNRYGLEVANEGANENLSCLSPGFRAYLKNRSLRTGLLLLSSLPLLIQNSALARDTASIANLARIPVREVTAFKDGHALVLQSGQMKTDSTGNVVLDHLPKPVLGTFWPFCSDGKADLVSAMASVRRVEVDNTSLTVAELLEGNPGAGVNLSILEGNGNKATVTEVDGVLDSIPVRSGEELERTAEPYSDMKLPERGSVVFLKTEKGLRVEPISSVRSVTFKETPRMSVSHEELRNLVTLNLNWRGQSPAEKVHVGMMYLQSGVRWVPNYKITFDGKGKAKIDLNATVENRLIDMNDVKLNLVVGVPKFPFNDQVDPFALNGSVASVVRNLGRNSVIASQFSNSIMLQGATNGTIGPQSGDLDYGSSMPAMSALSSSGKSEDMFVYTIDHVTLKKGQRLNIPVSSTVVDYSDVYTLKIPFAAPAEVNRSNSQRLISYERAIKAPRVIHKLRLKNCTDKPFTTAPALLVKKEKDGREQVLSQALMTYAAPGAFSDLSLSKAIDIKVSRDEKEISRTPDAVKWQSNRYCKVNLEGKVQLKNYGTRPVKVEVERQLIGTAEFAGSEGKFRQVNFFDAATDESGNLSAWWGLYHWPSWWHNVNGAASIKWNAELKPGQSKDLDYRWHYYWR